MKNKTQSQAEATTQAKQILTHQPVYLDTETTGVNRTAEIVEISIIDHDGTTLLDQLVKPRYRIPGEAMRVHGITNKMVEDAPLWVDIWPQVKATLANRRVAIYNADFDLRLIKQSHQQAGLEWEALGARAICIMKLYAQFYGEWDGRRGSYRWQSLEKAGHQCRLKLPNSHRAKADTLLTRALLRYMAGIKD